MNKRSQYIFLPTDGASKIALDIQGGMALWGANAMMDKYHLYVLSDDVVQDGDYFIDGSFFDLRFAQEGTSRKIMSSGKKVIATTDGELNRHKYRSEGMKSNESFIPSIDIPDVQYIVDSHKTDQSFPSWLKKNNWRVLGRIMDTILWGNDKENQIDGEALLSRFDKEQPKNGTVMVEYNGLTSSVMMDMPMHYAPKLKNGNIIIIR
jgi:hypothetical protein